MTIAICWGHKATTKLNKQTVLLNLGLHYLLVFVGLVIFSTTLLDLPLFNGLILVRNRVVYGILYESLDKWLFDLVGNTLSATFVCCFYSWRALCCIVLVVEPRYI